jgi:hypothetical protein
MDLGEKDLLGGPFQGTPLLNSSLERPQLPVGEPAGLFTTQVFEQRLGFEPRQEA